MDTSREEGELSDDDEDFRTAPVSCRTRSRSIENKTAHRLVVLDSWAPGSGNNSHNRPNLNRPITSNNYPNSSTDKGNRSEQGNYSYMQESVHSKRKGPSQNTIWNNRGGTDSVELSPRNNARIRRGNKNFSGPSVTNVIRDSRFSRSENEMFRHISDSVPDEFGREPRLTKQSPSTGFWEKRKRRNVKTDNKVNKASSKTQDEDFESLLKAYKDVKDKLANLDYKPEQPKNGKKVKSDVPEVQVQEKVEKIVDSSNPGKSTDCENVLVNNKGLLPQKKLAESQTASSEITASSGSLKGEENAIVPSNSLNPEISGVSDHDSKDKLEDTTKHEESEQVPDLFDDAVATIEDKVDEADNSIEIIEQDDSGDIEVIEIDDTSAEELILVDSTTSLDEDPDADLDVLELRRIALESTLKKDVTIAKKPASQTKTSKPVAVNKDRRAKRAGDDQPRNGDRVRRKSSPRPRQPIRTRRRRSRSPEPARTHRRFSSSSERRRLSESDRRRRQNEEESRRREEEKRRKQNERKREERKVEERKLEDQRREIQKILTLDDSAEQINLFLRLLSKKKDGTEKKAPKSPTGSKSTLVSKTPAGTKSQSSSSEKNVQSEKKQKEGTVQDNLEEVPMDIDSDPGSPGIALEQTASYETLKLGQPSQETELFQYMQQPAIQCTYQAQSYGIPNQMEQGYGVPYAESDINMWQNIPQSQPVPSLVPIPTQIYPPPPPPPLPPGDPKPPLPPPDDLDEKPPLPCEPHPDQVPPPPPPPPDSPVDDDDFGDEAAMLRAQLLKSMNAKKKEKQQNEEVKTAIRTETESPQPPSRESPIPLVAGSSSSDTSQEPKAKRQKHISMQHFMVPIQKPVIINLGEDSSDEEEDVDDTHPVHRTQSLMGGLDKLLKEARKNVDNRQKKVEDVATETGSQKVKKLEEQFHKQREGILKDQALFKQLLSKASKHKKSQTAAEENLQVLKDKLVIAEKIAAAKKEQFEDIRSRARKLRDNIKKRTSECQKLEQSMLDAGKEVYGESYKPRTVTAVKGPQKNKITSLSVTVINDMATKNSVDKENQETMQNIPSVTSRIDSVGEEKEKLQKMAEEYAKKIQLLKKAQMLKEMSIETQKSVTPLKDSVAIPRIEKIAIDLSEDSTGENEAIQKPEKRRRSLLDMNTSMRPNLSPSTEHRSHHPLEAVPTGDTRRVSIESNAIKINVQHAVLDAQESSPLTDGKDSPAPSPVKKIPPPNIIQLKKLMKMQEDNQQKFLSSVCVQSVSPHSHNIHHILLPKCQKIIDTFEAVKEKTGSDVTNSYPSITYKSPLLYFKSYRFSPYYRTKANLSLSSCTFSNKINHRQMLCKFDLQGTCLDEECKGQHMQHYTMSEEEVLQDLVSYYPALAGITKDTQKPQYQQLIGKYVSNTKKQHQGKLTDDQLKVLTVSNVNEKSGQVKPRSVFLTERRWRVTQQEKATQESDFTSAGTASAEVFDKIEWQNPSQKNDVDNIVDELDVRYFSMDTTNIEDMESAVLENPNDIHLWLKLSHKKLHDSNSTKEECLDHALNVLARGLEENKTSAELWYNYLKLYSTHKESSDLLLLCETALEYTQSYELWWLYMKSTVSSLKKMEICDQILDFIRSCMEETVEIISHWLLEIILYKTSLYIWSGSHQQALKCLQVVLKRKDEKNKWVDKTLIVEDKCLLWVSYVHLKEMKCLPPNLFDPVNQMTGRIMNKEKIMIDWQCKEQLAVPVNILVDLLYKAIDCCVGKLEMDNPEVNKGLVLYHNLYSLLKLQERYEEAITLCRKLLEVNASLIDIWLCAAELYSLNGDATATRQVFADALQANQHSAELFFYAANFEIMQGEHNKALDYLEHSVIVFFEIQQEDVHHINPNHLFCVLLDEYVPLNFQSPVLRENITDEFIQECLVYLWLNYSLLLELQGDAVQAIEIYETALSNLNSVSDVAKLWTSYLGFYQRHVSNTAISVAQNNNKLHGLVYRAISSLPSRYEVAYISGQFWVNYRQINMVVEKYMECVPEKQKMATYQYLVGLMPTNMELLLNGCGVAVKNRDFQIARSMCNAAILDNTTNIDLWKMMIALTTKLEGVKEVRRLYHKAIQVLPASAAIWKDFLLFEVSQRSMEVVPKIINKCQDLGIILQDFLDNILK